jgi:hypothetical protein
MGNKFCTYLINDSRAELKREVNAYLLTLDPMTDHHENFEKIKHWISQQPCVKSVEFKLGEIRTKPPIKEFLIEVINNGVTENKQIGIRFSDKGYEINIQLH